MSADSQSSYVIARELIDAAHRKDPAYIARSTHSEAGTSGSAHNAAEDDNGQDETDHQDEMSYADGVEAWAVKLLETDEQSTKLTSGPGGIELIRLAARCQHLERFLTPRSSFPEGKMGYLKWRKTLYGIQADRARELLRQAGVAENEADMVRRWVSKTDLQPGKPSGDAGTQLLEDAAVLVFLQDQLGGFAEKHKDYKKEKTVGILAKTWKKLSNNAKAAARTIPMDPGLQSIVAEAIQEVEDKEAAAAASAPASADNSARDQLADSMQATSITSNDEAAAAATESNGKKSSSSAMEYRANSQPKGRPKTASEARALLDAKSGTSASGQESSELDAGSAPIFGSRLLQQGDDYMSHNAWDHVEPPPEYQAMIADLLSKQAETKVDADEAHARYHADAASHWNSFYAQHEHRFFKDRRWLHLEFPELIQLTEASAGPANIFEIGCGAGNTVFPLLERNENPNLTIYACDYSAEAVDVVRSNPMYVQPPKAGRSEAFVWDLSSTAGIPEAIEPESVDVVVLIFVLSALHPREWKKAVDNVLHMLKPGGLVLLRDYGRHDLPQLRFRKGRMLDDNFYVRGDGTRVYFFTPEELLSIFSATSAPQAQTSASPDPAASSEAESASHAFKTLQMAVDRRMLVNRKENKQMYRCWMQAKFQKL